MFKKNFCAFLIISTILCGISFGVYASQNFTVKYSEKKNNSDKKTEILLEDTYADIYESAKKDFNLNNYVQVPFDQIMDLANGKIDGIDNTEKCTKLFNKYFELYQDPPKGSTIPLILVRKDQDEILVLYKESDGTNVVKYSNISNTNVNMQKNSEKRYKSKKYLEYNSIEID